MIPPLAGSWQDGGTSRSKLIKPRSTNRWDTLYICTSKTKLNKWNSFFGVTLIGPYFSGPDRQDRGPRGGRSIRPQEPAGPRPLRQRDPGAVPRVRPHQDPRHQAVDHGRDTLRRHRRHRGTWENIRMLQLSPMWGVRSCIRFS